MVEAARKEAGAGWRSPSVLAQSYIYSLQRDHVLREHDINSDRARAAPARVPASFSAVRLLAILKE